ncbi:MAG TPA: class I SAM-dependent methyltransferase [Solirubrobacteraceae bacterium]|nr:class I SAM-dependent methyltransferase [Solirubrobacteraceae bacterium]
MTATVLSGQARDAYEAIAPAYDVLTGSYAYERWLAGLEHLALEHGLSGRRLLDVACGTGASFLPMLARGYEVTGCDISHSMLDRARAKAPETDLYLADMRQLPMLGEFDLITCLDDALNYILDEDELEATLHGFATNLADSGLALWDLNTLAQYRGQFAHDQIISRDEVFIGWGGRSNPPDVQAGELVEVGIDVFAHVSDDQWQRTTSLHRQRHWPRCVVKRLAHSAGLELVDVRGQRPGAVIDPELDELVHTKAIYVAAVR